MRTASSFATEEMIPRINAGIRAVFKKMPRIDANDTLRGSTQFQQDYISNLRAKIIAERAFPQSYKTYLLDALGGNDPSTTPTAVRDMLMDTTVVDMATKWSDTPQMIELQLFIANYIFRRLGGTSNPIDQAFPFQTVLVETVRDADSQSPQGEFLAERMFGGTQGPSPDPLAGARYQLRQMQEPLKQMVILSEFRTWAGQIDVIEEGDYNILIGGGVILNLDPEDARLLGSQVEVINPQFETIRGYSVHRVKTSLRGQTVGIPATGFISVDDTGYDRAQAKLNMSIKRPRTMGEPGFIGYGDGSGQATFDVNAAQSGRAVMGKGSGVAPGPIAVYEAYPGSEGRSRYSLIRQSSGPNRGKYRVLSRANMYYTLGDFNGSIQNRVRRRQTRQMRQLNTDNFPSELEQRITASGYLVKRLARILQSFGGARSISVPTGKIHGQTGEAGTGQMGSAAPLSFVSGFVDGPFNSEQEVVDAILNAGIEMDGTGPITQRTLPNGRTSIGPQNPARIMTRQETQTFLSLQDQLVSESIGHYERMFATMSDASVASQVFAQIDPVMQTGDTPLKSDFMNVLERIGADPTYRGKALSPSRIIGILSGGTPPPNTATRQEILEVARGILVMPGGNASAAPYTLTELNEQ